MPGVREPRSAPFLPEEAAVGLPLLSRLYYLALRVLAWCGIRPFSAAVAIWDEDRILLVRNVYDACFCLPGGLMWKREDPALAACREVREEVGLILPPERLRLAVQRDNQWLFEVDLGPWGPPRRNSWEIAWVGFVEVREALEWRLTQNVREYLEARQLGPKAR